MSQRNSLPIRKLQLHIRTIRGGKSYHGILFPFISPLLPQYHKCTHDHQTSRHTSPCNPTHPVNPLLSLCFDFLENTIIPLLHIGLSIKVHILNKAGKMLVIHLFQVSLSPFSSNLTASAPRGKPSDAPQRFKMRSSTSAQPTVRSTCAASTTTMTRAQTRRKCQYRRSFRKS